MNDKEEHPQADEEIFKQTTAVSPMTVKNTLQIHPRLETICKKENLNRARKLQDFILSHQPDFKKGLESSHF